MNKEIKEVMVRLAAFLMVIGSLVYVAEQYIHYGFYGYMGGK